MDEKNILPLMVRDHSKIDDLIDNFEKNIDSDIITRNESFNVLEWKLEKHLFTEEKAIFTLYNPTDVDEGYKMLPKLIDQHNVIISRLKNWREDIRRNNKIEGFYDFKKFLNNHREFEEKDFYPKLDETLTEEQKVNIISRITEMI